MALNWMVPWTATTRRCSRLPADRDGERICRRHLDRGRRVHAVHVHEVHRVTAVIVGDRVTNAKNFESGDHSNGKIVVPEAPGAGIDDPCDRS